MSALPICNVVWFKRDLRLRDHAPLREATRAGIPVLLLHCFEPSWMQGADSDVRHWRFVRQSIEEMQGELSVRGIVLYSFYGEFLEVLDALRGVVRVNALFSHVETGNRLTFDRDRAVGNFCQKHGIAWREWQTNGVQRRLFHRATWDADCTAFLSKPLETPIWESAQAVRLPDAFGQMWHWDRLPAAIKANEPAMQPGGERAAWRYLTHFLQERSRDYFKNISKPEASRYTCSRISPYLAWGNLSIRQVYQATQHALAQTAYKRNLQQFTSRLFWQSHFIQKFETECRMEFENLNPGFNSIRQTVDEQLVARWRTGQTGFPLVDATMRCVQATGYLNFRMRAMLVSFLTHHLWQPWQAGVHHLARQFLDYEPGIHFSQFQMQSGAMGVNTIRIYNPVKQSLEHDPDGVFIRKWVPELTALPTPLLHEPWKMTDLDASFYRYQLGRDYPRPIVDLEKTHAFARETLWALRKSPEVRAANQRILRVHTKRKDEAEMT